MQYFQQVNKTKINFLTRFFLITIITIFLQVNGNGLFGQASIVREGVVYPIPPNAPNRMFFLQRTPNLNTIACDLNIINGKLNTEKPLITYWLRYGDSPQGERKELNYIQRTFAYGLTIKNVDDTKYEFWFVSYKKYHMYLLKNKSGEWKVYGYINNKISALNSIFIYIDGGTLWWPHVAYVELRGKNISTGAEEIQRLTDVKKEEN
jgi:hypothetical protein